MHQVESVKRNIEQQDQWVIPSSHEDKGDHVDDTQDTESISKMCQDILGSFLRGSLGPRNPVEGQGDVQGNDSGQKKTLEPGREDTNAPPTKEIDFFHVSSAEERSVEEILFYLPDPGDGFSEVHLSIIAQAGEQSDVSCCG